MSFKTTIQQLEERRDFYAAAVQAMKRIASLEAAPNGNAAAVAVTQRKSKRGRPAGFTIPAEVRARMSAGQRARRAKLVATAETQPPDIVE